jgi:hypothetical protein
VDEEMATYGGTGRRIRRFDLSRWAGLLSSLAATTALSLTSGFTLGGFGAAITNSSGGFSSSTIQLEESNGGTVPCYSTGTGSGGTVTPANTNSTCTINALVGTLDQVPSGAALQTTLSLTNVGNQAATIAELQTGGCSVAPAPDDNGYAGADLTANAFCGKVDVTISDTTSGAAYKCVFPGQTAPCPALGTTNSTLATLANQQFYVPPLSSLAAGATATYQVNVQVDSSATNADQGLAATVPFSWAISQ